MELCMVIFSLVIWPFRWDPYHAVLTFLTECTHFDVHTNDTLFREQSASSKQVWSTAMKDAGRKIPVRCESGFIASLFLQQSKLSSTTPQKVVLPPLTNGITPNAASPSPSPISDNKLLCTNTWHGFCISGIIWSMSIAGLARRIVIADGTPGFTLWRPYYTCYNVIWIAKDNTTRIPVSEGTSLEQVDLSNHWEIKYQLALVVPQLYTETFSHLVLAAIGIPVRLHHAPLLSSTGYFS